MITDYILKDWYINWQSLKKDGRIVYPDDNSTLEKLFQPSRIEGSNREKYIAFHIDPISLLNLLSEYHLADFEKRETSRELLLYRNLQTLDNLISNRRLEGAVLTVNWARKEGVVYQIVGHFGMQQFFNWLNFYLQSNMKELKHIRHYFVLIPRDDTAEEVAKLLQLYAIRERNSKMGSYVLSVGGYSLMVAPLILHILDNSLKRAFSNLGKFASEVVGYSLGKVASEFPFVTIVFPLSEVVESILKGKTTGVKEKIKEELKLVKKVALPGYIAYTISTLTFGLGGVAYAIGYLTHNPNIAHFDAYHSPMYLVYFTGEALSKLNVPIVGEALKFASTFVGNYYGLTALGEFLRGLQEKYLEEKSKIKGFAKGFVQGTKKAWGSTLDAYKTLLKPITAPTKYIGKKLYNAIEKVREKLDEDCRVNKNLFYFIENNLNSNA